MRAFWVAGSFDYTGSLNGTQDGADYAEFVKRAAEELKGEQTFHTVAVDQNGHTTHSFSITWRLFPKN